MNEHLRNRILTGDAHQTLQSLPDDLVDAVITSPPYFQLRQYDAPGQLGAERTIEDYVDGLHAVLTECRRVLKPTGSLWLNLGDTYSRGPRHGSPAKSLLLGPERLVLRLLEDGWRLRNRVIWHKPNPMPASVKDRLANTYEQLLFLTPHQHYFFDLDAIREAHLTKPHRQHPQTDRSKRRTVRMGRSHHPNGKNPGDVWTIPTSSYRGAHFATYPTELLRRPILATVPKNTCTSCGAPWIAKPLGQLAVAGSTNTRRQRQLEPDCTCDTTHRPGLVLDPFIGAGTTAVAAEHHHRDWLGIELNPDFVRLAEERIADAHNTRTGRHGRARAPTCRAA